MVRRFVLLMCVLMNLAACGAAPVASGGSAAPTAVALVPSATLAPPTLAPTDAPTATSAPTATLVPTDAPTATLAPTDAPTAEATAALAAADVAHDTASLADAQGHAVPAAPVPANDPAAAASNPVRLVIPKIELDRKLVSVGLDKNRVPIVPKHDIAWYNLSARPGQGENVVMWGHVLRFRNAPNIPAPFARLKDLPVGSRITVVTADGRKHNYVVTEKVYAKPDQVEYILPVGKERLTLVSCIGDKVVVDGSVEMSHRLITIAVPEK